MSQFKVEKGLDVQSIFSSHSLTSTDCRSKETVCYGFILSEFSSLLLCVISPFLVTKVKGLSDLSEKAKFSEKTEPSSKRSRGSAISSERPGSSHGRQTALKVRQLTPNLICHRCLYFFHDLDSLFSQILYFVGRRNSSECCCRLAQWVVILHKIRKSSVCPSLLEGCFCSYAVFYWSLGLPLAALFVHKLNVC